MKISISNLLPLMAMFFAFTIMSCGDTNNNDGNDATDEQGYSEESEDTMYLIDNDDTLARRVRLSDRIKNVEIELDRKITELDQKIENGTEAEKVKWKVRREKLAMERDQLKNDLDNVGNEVSNDWQQLENDVADRLDRISEDLRDDN